MAAPEASPPETPPVRLAEGNLLVAAPTTLRESCFAAPAIRALGNHRPDNRLAVACPEHLAPLWETVAEIDELIPYPDQAKARAIAGLIDEVDHDFSCTLSWEPSQASLAFARLGIAQRVGFEMRGRKELTDAIPPPTADGPPQHQVRFYLDLLQAVGIDGYVAASFQTPALPERPDPPRVALLPGSDQGPAYSWGVERFGELGELLAHQGAAELLLLALPGHAGEANELADQLGDQARNYANEFGLAEFLNALPYCTVVVSNDSAGAHLAAHAGVPVVALFGPGDPEQTRPLGRIHTVLSQHVECAPCNQGKCPLRHHRCLSELTARRVFDAVQDHLAPGTSSSES